MRLPISPTNKRRDRRGGFTLIELSLALLILGLIAAIALPRIMPTNSTSLLRFTTWQVASIMRADRNAAVKLRRPVTTLVDVGKHLVTSGATGKSIGLPPDLALRLDSPVSSGVTFGADGRATKALFVLARGSSGYGIRVNPFTGVVEIVVVTP